MKLTTPEQVKVYLDGFIDRTIFAIQKQDALLQKDPLRRMRLLLLLLGNPHEKLPSVLIAGTAGKGSTAYLTSQILTTAGYKTGLTISPHLQKVNERIQINNQPISDQKLIELIHRIIPAIEKMKHTDEGVPSFFEILVAGAFLLFNAENVDIAVVEVGLGGEFDATNVLMPFVAVLTNVSLDHTAILGGTVQKIAKAKAGIIKQYQVKKRKAPQQPIVITGVTQPSVIKIVEEKAAGLGSKVYRLGKDFGYTIKKESFSETLFNFYSSRESDVTSDESRSLEKDSSRLGSNNMTIPSISLSLLGIHQVENASLAIETVLQLKQFEYPVSEEQIRKSLGTAFFPGRFEKINFPFSTFNSQLILDGAHNVAKMQAFIQTLKTVYPKNKKIFLVAFKEDKNVSKMMKEILSVADIIICTEFSKTTDMSKKATMTLENIKNQIVKIKNNQKTRIYFIRGAEKAMEKAGKMVTGKDLIIVTGSLYLVGEIRDLVQSN